MYLYQVKGPGGGWGGGGGVMKNKGRGKGSRDWGAPRGRFVCGTALGYFSGSFYGSQTVGNTLLGYRDLVGLALGGHMFHIGSSLMVLGVGKIWE